MSLCKKISCWKSTNSSWWNIFFNHIIHFSYQNLKQFPKFLFVQSVTSTEHCSDVVHSCRLISEFISNCEFCTAQWFNLMACRRRILVTQFFCNTEAAVCQYQLHDPFRFSNTIVAASLILLLATLLLMLFCSVHVWEVFFLMQCNIEG
jgi:hypothetical protein